MKKIMIKDIDMKLFFYLFANFSIDLDENEKAIFGLPSEKSRDQAIHDWTFSDYEREI
jgi:hypothetical protein